MQRKTKSILEELDSIYKDKYANIDRQQTINNRANHVIASAIRLLEDFETHYNDEDAQKLQRKLLNAIRTKEQTKFTNTLRRVNVK